MKLSGSGQFTWAKNIWSYGDVEGQTIKTDAANNIFVAGGFDEYATDFDPGSGELMLEPDGSFTGFLLKLNSDGEFKWAIKPGGGAKNTNYELKRPMAIDHLGSVLLAYEVTRYASTDLDPSASEKIITSNGETDVFVQKLDSLGNLVWAKQIGGEDDDLVQDIITDKQNNVYIAGKFYKEIDFDPNEEWSTGINLDLAIDASGNIVCSGYMYDSSFDSTQAVRRW